MNTAFGSSLFLPGMGTTGMGAPRAVYLGLSVRIGYRAMLLGRQMMTAITSIMIQTSMKTVMPQITPQSGLRFCGFIHKGKNTDNVNERKNSVYSHKLMRIANCEKWNSQKLITH